MQVVVGLTSEWRRSIGRETRSCGLITRDGRFGGSAQVWDITISDS